MAIENSELQVAVIGCGLIGKRRAAQIAKDAEARLVFVVDVDKANREAVATQYGCQASSDWREVLSSPRLQAVVISTPNHLLAEIALAAIRAGKHLLVEKPLGRNGDEALAITEAAYEAQLILKTGFNHRFHPAIAKAKELVSEGKIGKLLNIRAFYGHGGRAGMEKEWRASKNLCGGGELLDQGVHLIDLIQWFAGDIIQLFGKVETKFWDIEVEDNGYVLAETNQNVTVLFHVSWTNWKNTFSFELFGTQGYLHINGLGGSYGTESLEIGLRKPEGGRPDISREEFPAEDRSWELEWQEFKRAIFENRAPLGSGEDGLKANRVIDAIYLSQSQQKRVEVLHEKGVFSGSGWDSK